MEFLDILKNKFNSKKENANMPEENTEKPNNEEYIFDEKQIANTIDFIARKETGFTNYDYETLDPLFEDSARLIVRTQQGSTSLIQRKYAIGYIRAERIMDQLEHMGIVEPAKDFAPRTVLIHTESHLEQILSIGRKPTCLINENFIETFKTQIENKKKYYLTIIEEKEKQLLLEKEQREIEEAKQKLIENNRKKEIKAKAKKQLELQSKIESYELYGDILYQGKMYTVKSKADVENFLKQMNDGTI